MVADILLRLGVGHDEQRAVAGVLDDFPRQIAHLQLGAQAGVRRAGKVDVVQRQTSPRHAPCRHRAVDAAGQQVQRAAAGADGQTARSLDLGAVDIGGMVADLDHDLQLGVVDIDPQVMVLIQQVGAQFAADLGAFHRVGLVGALGLDLKGAHAAQFFAKVGLGSLADGIKILGALDRTAELDDAEHMGNAAERLVHVKAFLLRLDENGALRLIDLELAQRLQPPADNLGEPCLKLGAVQPLQCHFALIGEDDFFHRIFLSL